MLGQLYTLSIMAFALGMDAFSVSLSVGLLQLRLKQIFLIGINIGIFHMFMPLIGMLIGRFLSHKFGLIATYVGGSLLIFLSLQMIISSLTKDEKFVFKPAGFGLFLFGLTVSIDSLAAGLTLGIYGAKMLIVIACFGTVTMILTWLGLLIGRRVQGILGSYSTLLGGVIMFLFGLKLLVL